MKDLGTPVDSSLLIGVFDEVPEGSIQMIYGRIRQGKSTEAVRRMLESLEQGRVVYSNILLDLRELEFDERAHFVKTFWSLFTPDRRFYVFHKENYHYFDPTEGTCDGEYAYNPKVSGAEVKWLNDLTDCEIYYDEGQWLLDSYEKTDVSVAKRKLITESGHVGRTIVVIAQRTQSVHVNARGNVNQFFRCSKRGFLFWNVLIVEEFQGMVGNDVDETAEPDSVARHWANGKTWKVFNTHYLRRGRPKSQEVHFSAYDLSYKERWIAFARVVRRVLPRLKTGKNTARDFFARLSLGVKSETATLKNVPSTPEKGVLSPFFSEEREKGSIQRYVGDRIKENKAPHSGRTEPNTLDLPF